MQKNIHPRSLTHGRIDDIPRSPAGASTFTGDLRRFAAWLSEHNCRDVCMESTGKYWIPVYNILEPTCKIVLAHPKYVKAIKGKKTDKRDAQWIADI